ncbi:MAG TPA: GntR family transcriptional regulator [Ilumatobacteraceae bacterium]|nr:GntR family transcriptional regulator [Ilumatobacteraceae bacterium]
MRTIANITDDLRSDILAGVFPPGDRLVELHLSERYAVGRASVRSALVELATEGLVERTANRGATVRRISIAEAIQITEARAALESLIARHAARHATAADCSELEGIVARMRIAVAEDEASIYSGLNSTLHTRLREISRHTVADSLVENLRNRSAHHQYRLASMPGRSAESVEQHASIVAAVVAHDGDAAASAMHDHLVSVIEALRKWDTAPAIRAVAGGRRSERGAGSRRSIGS